MGASITIFLLILILIYGAIFIVSIGMAVVQLIAMWKLYEKAGEPGWTAIVPVYSFIQMIKIALGKYTLAWIYLIICGVYTLVVFSVALISAFSEQTSQLETFQLLVMAAAWLLAIPLYAINGYTSFMFAKSYGKSTALCVLSIFFSGIMIIIFGFDKNTYYVGPKGIPQNNLNGRF